MEKKASQTENKSWLALIGLIFKELTVFIYEYSSRKVLKPYFGIETPYYKKWWLRRSYRTQVALDLAHDTDFARINYPNMYYGKH